MFYNIEQKGKNMELKDTIEMMNSENFQERFKAEYWQTKIRYDKLHEMVVKYDAWELDFDQNAALSFLRISLSIWGSTFIF